VFASKFVYLGKKVDLEGRDIHTVAGVLKLFFRELPEPLLTYELYDTFLAAVCMFVCFVVLFKYLLPDDDNS
jgi:hypothetical protein